MADLCNKEAIHKLRDSFSIALYQLAGTIIIKYYRWGGWVPEHRQFFPHSSRDWKAKSDVWTGLVSSETFVFGLYMTIFFPVLACSFSCVCFLPIILISLKPSKTKQNKDSGYLGVGPIPRTSFKLNHLFKDPTSCSGVLNPIQLSTSLSFISFLLK